MTTFIKEQLQQAIDKEIGPGEFIYQRHINTDDHIVKVMAKCTEEHITYKIVFKHNDGYIRKVMSITPTCQ